MRNAITAMGKVSFFLVLLIGSAVAQNLLPGAPPAASGPDYDVSVGYSYLAMPIPAAGNVNLNGVDLSGHVNFNPRWGAVIDSSYARTPDVLNTGHQGYLVSLLTGPVFYPFQRRTSRVFVRGLAGAGLVDAAIPLTDIKYLHGWQDRFSYAIGGGFERSLVGPLALRFAGDYLRTTFYDSTGTVQPQNNFRVTASLVIRLRDRLQNR